MVERREQIGKESNKAAIREFDSRERIIEDTSKMYVK
jgi:hypothetical protein